MGGSGRRWAAVVPVAVRRSVWGGCSREDSDRTDRVRAAGVAPQCAAAARTLLGPCGEGGRSVCNVRFVRPESQLGRRVGAVLQEGEALVVVVPVPLPPDAGIEAAVAPIRSPDGVRRAAGSMTGVTGWVGERVNVRCEGVIPMKALTYGGPGRRGWQEVPDAAVLDPEDAVVRVDVVTICGTDLHILKGDVPEVEPGRILGHEAVGTVTAVGPGVRTLAVDDRVLVSCISACGRCRFCRGGVYGQCTGGGGWILGHRIDGTQAEYVRTPFADGSLHKLPAGVDDEAAVLLADILPTSYEVGVRNGRVGPGDVVAVVGAGPIGLAAILTARLYSPALIIALDLDAGRLEAAERAGAGLVLDVADSPEEAVRERTEGGLGVDVAIEAVGVPESFELCTRLVRPGGRVANVGVHGGPATLHLEDLWARNTTITTGLVDTSSTPLLLGMLASGQLDVSGLVTHRFGLDEMQEAYDVFGRPGTSRALKVALFRT